MSRFELELAIRYLTWGRNRFAGFITWVSVIGLALGVLVLTVVVSVMNGFDGELKNRLLRTLPHITVADDVDAAQHDALSALPGLLHAVPYFQGTAVITQSGGVNPVGVFAVANAGPAYAELDAAMTSGSLAALVASDNGIVLGLPLALHLGLLPGDSVMMLVARADNGAVQPQILRFSLAGTFEMGYDQDYTLALLSFNSRSVAEWRELGEVGTQLRLADPLQAPAVAQQLAQLLPDSVVQPWTDSYGELFRAVRLEKFMMFVMLMLVVAVAAFNIISGQMMVVNEKRSEIAILQTMGARPGSIARVFLLQGMLIASAGVLVGLVLGLFVAFNINAVVGALESLLGAGLLDGSYFVRIPVRILVLDMVLIVALSWGLCILSAWLPSRRAAASNPVEGLHVV